ncbi:unnamed protein product [Owenia fusiformis]|uniref:BTB domain-containing protein n=1 Tax=Owenia fusiformis TaxID=6347 RepID=A0A8S4N463_OWEFU|nr:unnamed protein product [Owenia fusiformis]
MIYTRMATRMGWLKMADIETEKSCFYKPWPGSDIKFVMDDGKQVYASKAVLTIASPVFEAMFNSDFKEKEASQIPLPGKMSKDIVALVEVINPNTLGDITESTVEPLLEFAREYQMEHLTRKCEKFLLGCSASFQNLYLADEYNLIEEREKNMKSVHRIPMTKLYSYPDFRKLSKECTDDIILRKSQIFDSLRTVEPGFDTSKTEQQIIQNNEINMVLFFMCCFFFFLSFINRFF